MNFKEYQEGALRTESVPTELNFGEVSLHVALTMAIEAANILNYVKRTIYYGKSFEAEKVRDSAVVLGAMAELIYGSAEVMSDKNDMENFSGLPKEAMGVKPENVDLRVLHAAMGIFTEAGEALELVREQLEGNPFDVVGWGEEIGGDVSWYQAIGHDAAGTDEDVERTKNLAKLALRNKGKTFNAEATLNRDLDAERAILESTGS